MKKLSVCFSVFSVALALTAVEARAAMVVFSDSAGFVDTETSGTLSVPRFDSSLGTLTGVSFTVTGDISSILGVQNDSPGPISGSASVSVAFDLDGAGLGLGGSPDFIVSDTTGLVALAVGGSTLVPVMATDTLLGSAAPGPDFLGPGTVDLDYETTTSFDGAGFGGDITISQSTDAAIAFEITYTYDEIPGVPLPAAGLLLAAATGGLMVLRRRR